MYFCRWQLQSSSFFLQVVSLALLAFLGAVSVQGQALLNPNEIEGTIRFTNSDPAVLTILNAEGFTSGSVFADSVGVSPTLNNSTNATIQDSITATYEVTVEAGGGIEYDVWARMRLDSNQDIYNFAIQRTDPVQPDPAPAETRDLEECAGIVDVRWEDSDGNPVTVSSATLSIFNAFASKGSPTSRETVAVRGDGLSHPLVINFSVGSDPFSDQIRLEHRTDVVVSCDVITEVVCVVPQGGGEGDLGIIIGELDKLGEDEVRTARIQADDGPFGNFRLDDVSAPQSPGNFELENLLPSDATAPARGYRVYSNGLYTGLDTDYQWLRPPGLGFGSNPRVTVSAGVTEDLTDTFVIDPGFVEGDIYLLGPTAGGNPANSCLADLFRASDLTPGGLPFDVQLSVSSRLGAVGTNSLAPGALMTASFGETRSLFEGSFDAFTSDFSGNYEMCLGGLNREASIWTLGIFTSELSDFATPEIPETYQRSRVTMTDRLVGANLIQPGGRLDVPIRYCYGEVGLTLESTSNLFYSPRLSGSGGFLGTNFEGDAADYAAFIETAAGTPISSGDAANEGLINLCIPEGTYTVSTFVTSINSGGGTSNTEVPPVTFTVGCGQRLSISPFLQIALDPLADCVSEPEVDLTGTVTASDPIEEISATVNAGAPIAFCAPGVGAPDCGASPLDFDFAVPLAECDNEIVVTTFDDQGRSAMATDITRFDNQAPTLAGCEDVVVPLDSSEGALVSFDVTATDNCDADLAVECDPASGSFFPAGSTEVTCSATDACGNQASCMFNVTVGECEARDLFGTFHNEGGPNVTIDSANGGSTTLAPAASFGLNGVTTIAHDPATNSLYAATGDGDDSLWRLDLGAPSPTGAPNPNPVKVGRIEFLDHNGAAQLVSNVQAMDLAPESAGDLGFEVGMLYAVSIDGVGSCNPNCFFKIDPATGAATQIGTLPLNQGRGASFNPITGEFWVFDSSTKSLYTLSPDGVLSFEFQVGSSHFDTGTGIDTVFSLAHDCQGKLYAVDVAYGVLVHIDEATGQATWVGSYGSVTSPSGSFDIQALDGGALPANIEMLFADDMETGDTSRWGSSVP